MKALRIVSMVALYPLMLVGLALLLAGYVCVTVYAMIFDRQN